MGSGLKGYGDCSEEVTKACPIEMALQIVGGKWKGIIIDILSEKSIRFNELKRVIPGISQRILTLQLRELEADGIVKRKVDDTVPPKVEYFLTEQGNELSSIINSLRVWGQHYLK
ncbi:winged helix-turn-helix transcriptional regulator [Niallia circulans]|jgi:DNA-binding HxlR family transcriptional regulator|uniref:winged helix-turn-helix transcriptional regulator n=1 Tax=Niallia circulans TaxID=1397 RepID=UPI00156004C2|nr:helix-turn-helix domain-containing protein [Niallia circulans]NRG31905.1 helix-turn-helix transcriptional regulator [Niallia circulans]